MKNFVKIALVFSLLSFAIGFLSPEFTFLGIGLALVIMLVSFINYLGLINGVLLLLMFTILPGVIESYGFKWNIPFFQGAVVQNITHSNWRFALDPQTFSSVMVIAIIFAGALTLSHQLSNLIASAKYEKLRLMLVAALLVALTFINTVQGFNGLTVLRWFVIALVIFALSQRLARFNLTQKIFISLPIFFFYFLPTYTALTTRNYSIFLIMAIIGTIHLFLHILKSPSLRE